MTTIEDLNKFLHDHGHALGGEPEFVLIKSPIGQEDKRWWVELVWMHHDGDIGEMVTRDESLQSALDKMMEYLVNREQHILGDIPYQPVDWSDVPGGTVLLTLPPRSST